MNERQEKIWAMLCHLGVFMGFVLPFFNIIAPLIIWLIMKKKSSLVNEQGKESVNFQISMTIYFIFTAFFIWMPSLFHSTVQMLIGYGLIFGIAIFTFIMVITASVKVFIDKKHCYPLTIRFIR